jgi:hypothetical protein
MQVDVDNARLALFLMNNMVVPDFLEHCFCHGISPHSNRDKTNKCIIAILPRFF